MNNSHGSKLDSADLLILGMEGLRADGLVPVSHAAIGDAGSVNVALDRQKIEAALTSAVLYAVVVELVVKHIWEQEHGKAAAHNHDLHRLFQALSSQTQRDVDALYNNCCVKYEAAVQAGQQQHGPGVVAVDMANLEEALQWKRRRCEEPQVRHDATRPQCAHRSSLECRDSMGRTQHVSQLRHRTDTLGNRSQLQRGRHLNDE